MRAGLGQFRILDALVVLTGPSLPAPRNRRSPGAVCETAHRQRRVSHRRRSEGPPAAPPRRQRPHRPDQPRARHPVPHGPGPIKPPASASGCSPPRNGRDLHRSHLHHARPAARQRRPPAGPLITYLKNTSPLPTPGNMTIVGERLGPNQVLRKAPYVIPPPMATHALATGPGCSVPAPA